MLSRSFGRAADIVIVCGAMIVAYALTAHYGQVAVSPHGDIIWDGGYKVLGGDIPWRDFFASQGLPQSVIQAVFFAFLGVTWSAYVAHAAVLNALMMPAAYALLRLLGVPRVPALATLLATAGAYYADAGVPNPDKHAFLLMVLMAAAQVRALRAGTAGRLVFLCYLTLMPLFVLGFLCKANPIVLMPALMLVLFAQLPRPAMGPALGGGLAGLVLVALCLAALEVLWPGMLAAMAYYAVKLPFLIGLHRTVEGGGISPFALWTVYQFNARTFLLVPALGLAWLGLRLRHGRGRGTPSGLAAMSVGLGFLVITLFHMTHLFQPQNGQVTLIFLALTLVAAGLWQDLERHYPGMPARSLILPLLYVFLAMDGVHHLISEAALRKGFGTAYDYQGLQPPGAIGIPALASVRWLPEVEDPDRLDRMRQAVAMARSADGGVALSGLPNLYYGLAGKPSLSPLLFYWPGHSSPEEGSAEEARIRQLFNQRLQRFDVRHLIVDRRIWSGVKPLVDAPGIACAIDEQSLVVRVRVCPNAPQDKISGLFWTAVIRSWQ